MKIHHHQAQDEMENRRKKKEHINVTTKHCVERGNIVNRREKLGKYRFYGE